MKIGITQIILGEMSLDETLRLCQEAGYEAVELTFRPGKDLHPDLSDSELEAVRRRCESAGVQIASAIAGGSGGGNLLSPDPQEQRQGRERVRRSLEIADALGVSCTLLHPGQLGPEGTYQEAWDRLRDALAEMIPLAQSHRCAIAVENVWNKFLLSPREMCQFIDELDSPWIGAYLDTANMMAYGYTEHWIRALKSRIKRVHFKDFRRREHRFVRLGEGDTDWPTVIRELRAIGYDGPVIHEVSGSWEEHIQTAATMREIVALE